MATKAKETAVEAMPDVSESAMALNTEAKGIDFIPDSWQDVAEFFEGEVIEFQGSPYTVVKKDALVEVPFMITDVRFYESKQYDSEAVAICCITEDGQKLVFNDGSTGVFQQVKHMVATSKRKAGILCSNGLRKSTYKVEIPDGFDGDTKEIEASTFYVA